MDSTNRYLSKIAAFPGTFLSIARTQSRRNLVNSKAKTFNSGLRNSLNVSGSGPKITGGRTSFGTPTFKAPGANSTTSLTTSGSFGSFTKSAMQVTVNDVNKPFKEMAETILINDGKVLVVASKCPVTGKVCYTFPETSFEHTDFDEAPFVDAKEGMLEEGSPFRGVKTYLFVGKEPTPLSDDSRELWLDKDESKSILGDDFFRVSALDQAWSKPTNQASLA